MKLTAQPGHLQHAHPGSHWSPPVFSISQQSHRNVHSFRYFPSEALWWAAQHVRLRQGCPHPKKAMEIPCIAQPGASQRLGDTKGPPSSGHPDTCTMSLEQLLPGHKGVLIMPPTRADLWSLQTWKYRRDWAATATEAQREGGYCSVVQGSEPLLPSLTAQKTQGRDTSLCPSPAPCICPWTTLAPNR